MASLILTCASKVDIIQISEWYELHTPGTGERFLKSLDEKFDAICMNPEIHRIITESGIRKSKLEQWPYQIFFVCGSPDIEVLAIIHTSRAPGYISERIN